MRSSLSPTKLAGRKVSLRALCPRGAEWILRNGFGPLDRSRSVYRSQVPGANAVLMCRLQDERPESEADALVWSPKGPGDAARQTETKTAADGAERRRICQSRQNTCDVVFRSGWEPAQQFHRVAGGERAGCLGAVRGASELARLRGRGSKRNRFFVPVEGEDDGPTREEVSVRGRV